MKTIEKKSNRALLDKVWGIGWRIALGLLAVLGLYYAILRCSFIAKHRNAVPVYHAWNGQIAYGYEDGETLYLYDTEKQKRLSRDWAWISDVPTYPDSLAVFCEKSRRRGHRSLRGYFNARTGKVEIRPRFERAWIFSEGLGAVSEGRDMVGFIGADGQYVLPPKYPYVAGLDYLFRDGYCMLPDAPSTPGEQVKIGAIDRSGQWAVPPQFDFVRHVEARTYIVKKNGKYGMLDHRLNWLLQPEYDRLLVFSSSERVVCATKGAVQQLLTFEGEIVAPFLFDSMDNIWYATDDDQGARISDYLWFSVDGRKGILDAHNGKVIIPAAFVDVDLVSPQLFECTVIGDDRQSHCFLFDTQGHPLGEKVMKETQGIEKI
jgi:hypothetical protein